MSILTLAEKTATICRSQHAWSDAKDAQSELRRRRQRHASWNASVAYRCTGCSLYHLGDPRDFDGGEAA